ncbi:MAG: hypothetical protein Q8L51_01320 [Candidatus Amesbacteria bacterium]|nr:hypothetical protein [Candidatus Amesbacteria bacterium]
MLELPHVLVGAAIGVTVSNPVLSLPLSLLSHFATDYLPHWNPHINTEIKKYGSITQQSLLILAADSGGALVLGSSIAYLKSQSLSQFLVIMACCLMAVLPDVLEIPYYFFKQKISWMEKLIDFQRAHQWNVPALWGVLAQIIVSLGAFFIIFT